MLCVSFSASASGILCFGPSMMASIAFILSIVANSKCDLVDLDEDNLLRLLGIGNRPEPDSVGLWCFEATNGNRYDISDLDLGSKFDAARGLGITAVVLGFCIWLAYMFAACVRFPPKIFKLIGGLCILICMFQGLVFLVFKSDRVCDGDNLGCSLGTAGKCGVSAVVFWFLAGIFSCAAGKEKDDDVPVNEAPAEEAHDKKVQDETAAEAE
jgi:hypothetical protein